jgi:MFS family permease
MILRSKTFGSYAIPWLIFNIANGLLSFGKLSDQIENIKILGTALEFFATIFTALAAGFIADRIGRKQPMMAGLVVLGIGYAFFGLVNSQDSYIVYLIVEGIAWGLIAVIYMQVILWDISANSGSKERYYALGGIMIPFLTRTVFLVGQEISGLTVAANSLSTILSIITFLSVIPLLRAPETLPENIMRERKLKKHVKDVGELVSKSKKK